MLFRSYQQKHFLIIDDFDSFIVSMKQGLRRMGAENIDSARNGDEAIQLCLKKHYDVVFCDYNMGDHHKNGQQVLEELRYRKLLKNTDLFVIVSAEAGKEMVMGALEYQPDGYITKPITQTLLQSRVDRMIAQKVSTADIDRAIDQEDYSRAISLANTQLKVDPKNRAWLVRTLANLHFQQRNFDQARAIYEEVLSKRPLDWARMGLGKSYCLEGRLQEAIETFEALVADSPEMVGAYDWLARCYKEIGRPALAQETLVKAVNISPRAILRQQELASLSRQLNDLETAAKAYKASTKLSDKSCYENPDTYLDYSRTLTCLAETSDNPRESVRIAAEAVSALDTVRRKYQDNKVQLQSYLLEAQACSHQNNPEATQKALRRAQERFDPEDLEAQDTSLVLEMAETLYCLGQSDEADTLLQGFAARFPNEPSVQARVEEMLEEPVSQAQRLKAREQNRQGIELYEQNELNEAIALFEEALAITPRQPGLNLNYLQALLKRCTSGEENAGRTQLRARPSLERLENLSPNHRQYKRYQQIQKRYQALSGKQTTVGSSKSDE